MFNLTTKELIDINAPLESGMYRIYWLKNGISQSISRICGNDSSGLLYIGHTAGTLQDRLNQFRCSAFLRSTNHSGGLKYRNSKVLLNLIKPDELFAKVEPCKGSHDSERNELKKYADKFGEVPPLNG